MQLIGRKNLHTCATQGASTLSSQTLTAAYTRSYSTIDNDVVVGWFDSGGDCKANACERV